MEYRIWQEHKQGCSWHLDQPGRGLGSSLMMVDKHTAHQAISMWGRVVGMEVNQLLGRNPFGVQQPFTGLPKTN